MSEHLLRIFDRAVFIDGTDLYAVESVSVWEVYDCEHYLAEVDTIDHAIERLLEVAALYGYDVTDER